MQTRALSLVLILAAPSLLAQRPPLSSAAKSADSGHPAQSALATAPACPLISSNATTHQSETEPITLTYDAAKGPLRAAKSVTLHAAAVPMNGLGTVEDFPMVRQADGTWLATVTLKGSPAVINYGYVMFDVEDQDHHIDRNGGAYWDTGLCFTNRNIPNSRYSMGFSVKMSSYNGHLLAPGFQRAPDPAKALEIVREDFAKYPQDYGDLFWIWNLETKNGRGSWEDWNQVSQELYDAVLKYGTDTSMFRQVMGFVAPNQELLNPGTLEKFRAAIIALPEKNTVPPTNIGHVAQAQWDEIRKHEANFLLSQLDLPPLFRIADPSVRGAAYDAFTKRYGDCGVNCNEVAEAYGDGVMAYGEAGDLDGAQRMGSTWMEWDAKNPDAPATLAQTYLKANARLPQALELVNRAAALQAPFATMDAAARQKVQTEIRANNRWFTVNPFREGGSIESLRSKIEAALGK